MKDITPIFLFSLPRSGSTLLQRLIATNSNVSTAPEPWVLLHLFYMFNKDNISTEYGQLGAVWAYEDFVDRLPNGMDSFNNELKKFCLALYRQAASSDCDYFIDKTPRYSLISNQIVNVFDNGRFVFLWRNPLDIIASIVDTWGNSGWIVPSFNTDLSKGLLKMIETYRYSNDKCYSITYEKLVSDPEEVLKSLYEYLGIKWNADALNDFFKVDVDGVMGDPKRNRYKNVMKKNDEVWRQIICNPFRKHWTKKYLLNIGKENFAFIGYDLDSMIEQLDSVPLSYRYICSDLILFFVIKFRRLLNAPFAIKKLILSVLPKYFRGK